jgi:Uma2 family endonuclease
MDAAKKSDKIFSFEAYLSMEEQAEEKHEFVDGEILAMSGGSARHNLISANVIITLGTRLRSRGCRLFSSDMKVEIAEYNHFVYPDVTVVCGDISYAKERKDIIDNPSLICEVLSDSTEAYDRGRKFFRYRSLPSLQTYLLVSQHETLLEVYTRQDANIWQMTNFSAGMTAILPEMGIEFPVDEIYLGA